MMRKAILLVSALVLVSTHVLWGDVPRKSEQLVYATLAFNGADYSYTFCGEASDTFYVLANTDNFITVRKTFVYFWPITGELMTDYDTLNEIMEGYCEISGSKNGEALRIERVRYTYFNVRGEYENNWKVLTDEEAVQELNRWRTMYNDYTEAVDRFHSDAQVYNEQINELMKRVQELQEEGKDVQAILEQINDLEYPEEPLQPFYYNVPPSSLEEAFIFHLPPGEYGVRFLLQDGTVLEGSEKRIVAFEKRRGQGVGFDVIPGDKWTRPNRNNDPSAVLYVNGTADLYLRAYYQDEYNDRHYNRLVRNDSSGNMHMFSWKRVQQVPGATLELTEGRDESTEVSEEPFVVEQVEGASMGYTIVPYEPFGKHEGRPPNIVAFHIPISAVRRKGTIRLLDRDGVYIPHSERRIRVIPAQRFHTIPFVYALLPIVCMIVVIALRRRKYLR